MARQTYASTLKVFMEFRDSEHYEDDRVFLPDELAQVTAHDVLDWLNFRAFGTTEPTDDDRPMNCRSSSLFYWKKALSHFMPNKMQ